jgi:NDP-sugar pyrophosphorylase family protein
MGLTGVIPAAGKATRMGAVGASLPKALIEIEGRTLLERSIETLKSIGVSRVVVVVGHLGQKIVERVSGVEIAYQEQPLGLAHAIATAAPQIESDFVVLCPDNVYSNSTDLIRAREVFESNKPVFLLVGTVTPNRQRDRKAYFTSARLNLEPNVYTYHNQNNQTEGLAINSTGCTFFKREALDYLPVFSNQEQIFRDYLETIIQQRDGLIY